MKNLLIKLGLWEEKGLLTEAKMEDLFQQASIFDRNEKFLEAAFKHYCQDCNRWFDDVRGKLMHDRHRHKDETTNNQSSS